MKETLEMALEALTNPSTIAVQHAVELIKKELAQPEREWVGLTLDDIPESYAGDKSFLNIARWAEAKLKEKNHG